jgi:glutamate--cysteine ligase
VSAISPSMDLGALAGHLAARAFSPQPAGEPHRRIGAEVELLALDAEHGAPMPLDPPRGRGTIPFLRVWGAALGWVEGRTARGTPCFAVPGGGAITFEPGGQLEYGSPPLDTASALLAHLDAIVPPLRAAAADAGILLLARGIDPVNPLERAPLQLRVERYRRMAEYFASLGPAGARMMRQTAALQISLDRGPAPAERWVLLNRLAPYLVAIFASSSVYAGAGTGHRSWRASTWRSVDASRTGILPEEGAPVARYLELALCAPDMMRRLPEPGGRWLPFIGWVTRGEATPADWETHLSTLFPEVRPRGWFEVRSIDAVDPAWYPAVVALLAGLAYDDAARAEAATLLADGDAELLRRAGRDGLRDATIRRTAADLVDLALAGCARLGADYLHPRDLERARERFDACTRLGLDPGNDEGPHAVRALASRERSSVL